MALEASTPRLTLRLFENLATEARASATGWFELAVPAASGFILKFTGIPEDMIIGRRIGIWRTLCHVELRCVVWRCVVPLVVTTLRVRTSVKGRRKKKEEERRKKKEERRKKEDKLHQRNVRTIQCEAMLLLLLLLLLRLQGSFLACHAFAKDNRRRCVNAMPRSALPRAFKIERVGSRATSGRGAVPTAMYARSHLSAP